MLNRVANNPKSEKNIKNTEEKIKNFSESNITLEPEDRSPANTFAENKKGALKQNKKFKFALAAAIAGIVIVGVAIGTGVGIPFSKTKVSNSEKDFTISQKEEELVNKDSIIESLENINETNRQTLISNMNQNFEEARQSYFNAKEYFKDIGNPFQIKDEALIELNNLYEQLTKTYETLLEEKVVFENANKLYEEGKTSIENLGLVIENVNNLAGQVEKGADVLYDACKQYNIYQINFSQTDLKNSDAQGLFVDKHFAGTATSIESCTYAKNSGDITIIVQIKEDPKPGQEVKYITSVIKGNIGAEKTTQEVTPTNIINALKKDNSFSRTTYSLEMGSSKEASVSTAGDQMNSGSIKVEYFANNKYDAKSGTTQVSGGAIIKVYNSDGSLAFIKEYDVRLGTCEGKVDKTSEIKEALQRKIIESGVSTNIINAVIGEIEAEAEL